MTALAMGASQEIPAVRWVGFVLAHNPGIPGNCHRPVQA